MTSALFPETFRAYEYTKHGPFNDVVRLSNTVKHVPLGPADVRIKVHSAALNPADYKFVEFESGALPSSPTVEKPFHVGFDIAGTLVEIGVDVKEYKVGDQVFAMAPNANIGAFAEFHVLDVQYIASMPKRLTYNQAAGIPLASLTSFQALTEHSHVTAGSRVLILGGSSGCGGFAVQIAKALGAYVFATTSTRNIPLVQSLGADRVIDYTQEKWVDVIDEQSIDVIYDCGVEANAWNIGAQKVLKAKARFVTLLPIAQPQVTSAVGATASHIRTRPDGTCLKEITKLIDAGNLNTPIDSVHLFENLFEAMAIQRSGRARGKIILEIAKEL